MAGGLGIFGRFGLLIVDRRRAVFGGWLVLVLALGALAPFAEGALSGAGWEAKGSESLAVRRLVDAEFPGRGSYALWAVVSSRDAPLSSPAGRASLARVARTLREDAAVRGVVLPTRAAGLSRDGRTGVVLGLAADSPSQMVEAARRLEGPIERLGTPTTEIRLTGTAAMWADFNRTNKEAMLRSEIISWPLTLGLMVVAFGSLVAAGLPLLLTMIGLACAMGVLFLAGQLTDVTIWAMNFAMMFAIALGIDYALFLTSRFRNALAIGLPPREAVGEAMETAGKAVFFSALAVFAALMAVALVPSPAFRTMPFGIALAILFVLLAALTLLPALLSKLGPRVNRAALPFARGALEARNERFARLGERLWRRPLLAGALALVFLLGLATPVLGLRTGMPSVLIVPDGASAREGFELVGRAFGPGAFSTLDVVAPKADEAAVERLLGSDPRIAQMTPPLRSNTHVLVTAVPTASPGSKQLNATIDGVRRKLPPGALVGGAAAENRDLEHALIGATPLVYGTVVAIGFLLLLLLLRAPLIAATSVVLNLLATGAALGVARLVFQDGALESVLRFHSQGFVDAWAPVFFFAMVFALAMDYTVFLLATVKERFEQSGDARLATIGGLAASGRVINAAGGVMVVVFLTFALAGPIPPKEMGFTLAVAVLLDATLIRLVLLPVLLRLLGNAAWWCPAWLDHVLPRIRLSHGEPAPEAPPVAAA